MYCAYVTTIRELRKQLLIMTEDYFEKLERRNAAAYADAYSYFYADMFTIAANVFGEDFSQSFTVMLNFVPMMHQTNKDEVFIAEKTTASQNPLFILAFWILHFSQTNLNSMLRLSSSTSKITKFLMTSSFLVCYP